MALGDPDENVRYRCIVLLGEHGDHQVLNALASIRQNDTGENWEGEPLADIAVASMQRIIHKGSRG